MKKTKYDVFHNGEYVTTINPELVKAKKIDSDTLKLIKSLHEAKYVVYKKIEKTNDSNELKELSKQLTNIEFELQKAWGFKEDINFHRFWTTPKCTCPKMDNEDNYPHGYYITNSECPLHGQQVNEIENKETSTEEKIKIISYLNVISENLKQQKEQINSIENLVNNYIKMISK